MYSSEKSLFVGIVIFAVFFLTIFCGFVWSLLKSHKRRLDLYRAKILSEIVTRESERARIAQDLHDGLSPVLAGASLQIGIATSYCSKPEPLEKASGYIDDVISEMRAISYNLMPRVLLRDSLKNAVAEFLERYSESSISIDFNADDIFIESEIVKINLFRIIQEIVTNTIKYSKAAKLIISMKVIDRQFILETKDDGKGFEQAQEKDKFSGSGIENIKSRVEVLGGKLCLAASRGEGVYYKITMSHRVLEAVSCD